MKINVTVSTITLVMYSSISTITLLFGSTFSNTTSMSTEYNYSISVQNPKRSCHVSHRRSYDLRWLAEKHFDDEVTTFWVVEEDKETPVDEPCALFQQHQRRRHRLQNNQS